MPVFDKDTPVRPAIDGQVRLNGIEMCAGDRDSVRHFISSHLAWHDILAADIETVGTDVLSFQIKVVTIGSGDAVVALDPRDPWQADQIRALFEHVGGLIFHNAAFDIPPLVQNGLMKLVHIEKVYDTLTMARMAEPDTLVPKDLTSCAKRYLGIELDTANSIKKAFKAAGYKTLSEGFAEMDISSPIYLQGAMMDTAITHRLADPVWKAAHDRIMTGHPFTDRRPDSDEAHRLIRREQIVNRVMLRRSAQGLPVDLDFLENYRDQHTQRLDQLTIQLNNATVRPGNGADLVARLDQYGQLPSGWKRTPKGAASSAAGELEKLTGNPLVTAHLEYKGLTKVTTYLEQVEAYASITGRIHPQVNVLGASATGRMSYGGGVPLQQFPAAARGIILAEPGKLLTSIDWSSIEPIVMANAAGERVMVDAYERGEDLYGPVMQAAGVERKAAKVVLLAQMYGQGLTLLADNLGLMTSVQDDGGKWVQMPDEMAAGRLRNDVMGAMPSIKQFLHQLKTIGENYGQVTTISGRILSIPKAFDGKGFAGYKAQNYFCQGSAYDVLAETIYSLHQQGLSQNVVMAMHDELVIDADPQTSEQIRQLMELPPDALCRWARRTPRLRTDLEVLGERWSKPE